MHIEARVTIGLCVKNNETTVEGTVRSIVHQDFPHKSMDLIVVDGCSKDRTFSIIQDGLRNSDIKARFLHEGNGLGTARQMVVDNAKGKYIIWVDGDNLLPTDHVRRQVEFMEQNPNVGIGKARNGMLPQVSLVAMLESIPFVLYDAKAGPTVTSPPATSGSIYRVKAIRQAGGFNCEIKGAGEDQDAAYRVQTIGWTIKRSATTYYEYRVKTWKALWEKYLWYGYGCHYIYLNYRNIFSLFRMSPIAGFVTGALWTTDAFSATHRRSVFLLPFHFAFKMTAWCLGFAKGQMT